MKNQNRTDRILLAVALLAFFLAMGGFYFDQWMWGRNSRRGEKIGMIVARKGDVRMKFENDLKWQKAINGQDLEYNDAVYAGAGGEAELEIGDSKLTVTENTLVVLRRNQNVSFLNLNYGTLFGKVGKRDKLLIDTGDGKPIELNSRRDSTIVVRRADGKTQLDVTSGEATVNVSGQETRFDKSGRLVVGDKSPVQLKPNHIALIKPLKTQTIVSESPTHVDFAWEWTNGRPAARGERFILEFSSQPSFQSIHIAKTVEGSLTTSMTVSRTLSLYYRVRGQGGEISPVGQVNFMRLESPLIVRPLVDSRFQADEQGTAAVDIEFKKADQQNVHYQIAREPAFRAPVLAEDTNLAQLRKNLPAGTYYIRARTQVGSHATEWSEARVFAVDRLPDLLKLANRHTPTLIQIPNRPYPRELYVSPPEQIKSFLAGHGLMRRYFAFHADEIDELDLSIEDRGRGGKEQFAQRDSSWPVSKLYPGQYEYRMRAAKRGFRPSEWTQPRPLEIVMEPPKPQGEAVYGKPNDKGLRSATWNFTPLLFAKSYDVEVSSTPDFSRALELRSQNPWADIDLPDGEYYWRARGRDASGRIISAFSSPYKLKSMPVAVPKMLAKNESLEEAAAARHPASPDPDAELSSLADRMDTIRRESARKSGWWAWLGSGANYIDYKQSIPAAGTLDVFHVTGGGQYFEGGYSGQDGVGGMITYKNTPGNFTLADSEVPITPNSYRWTTLGLEAVARKKSTLVLGQTPIVYGMRVGVQEHQIPFLFLNGDQSALILKNNQMTTASLGVLAELTRRKWTYYWLSRYQFPLTSRADGATQYSMSPIFAFDGSLGLAYSLTHAMKLGFFWYGQWHQFNFVYGDGTVTNAGSESLFYSAIDLRLGFDF